MSGPDEDGRESAPADFWSRRKAAVRQAEETEQQQRDAASLRQKTQELEQKSDEEILAELDLPDPDTLCEKDDFSRFLSAAVPERLRRRALRRLWTLNPVLANLDGLCDYAEDYTDAATVVSDMQTLYQVGKGMFDRFAAVVDTEEAEDVSLKETTMKNEVMNPDVETQVIENQVIPEENIAAQHDYIQKGKTTFQLTHGNEVGQADTSTLGGEGSNVAESLVSEEEFEKPKRRMRFEYS